ncbi:hypothetical protein SPOG_03585 [Schizosaccharomyces cryophilus OY26]|uniref:Mug135-like C-terminal domain-containing protein n=1 Tax=Schizosaccharomyces cryophilus (strain OY26 / ATCC MYA-4695 / CBS 11777 / NBRC 106824 / NRRL Y48691) TaxID=653667 RepID=S9WZH2_SCHCR|nr:uncharacterized protein SPOG_03585 [Schizosaccharomyces cryophilus OY26]EPY50117.1 hypothetical protein SPOG_03585 [Schizosaccharomyces cryophilus OY26]
MDARVFVNEFNIPPPTTETSEDVMRFLKDFEIAAKGRNIENEGRNIENEVNVRLQKQQILNVASQFRQRERTLEDTPPRWFQMWVNDENGFSGLFNRIGRMETRMDRMETKMDRMEARIDRIANVQRRSLGFPIDVVPFLNGEEPTEKLPQIRSVEDIDLLTKDQCTSYLNGYGIRFNPNETIKLKERLRDVVGLMSAYDLAYQFSGFP